jgi:hypothetical protein
MQQKTKNTKSKDSKSTKRAFKRGDAALKVILFDYNCDRKSRYDYCPVISLVVTGLTPSEKIRDLK